VFIKGSSNLTRITSKNHPINVMISDDKCEARAWLADDLARTSVPHQDFVLLFRDDSYGKPVGTTS
jgi:hypothetical protein